MVGRREGVGGLSEHGEGIDLGSCNNSPGAVKHRDNGRCYCSNCVRRQVGTILPRVITA